MGSFSPNFAATRGNLNYGRFMIRRMFKIWPSYYCYLFILALIILNTGESHLVLVPLIFHVQNYRRTLGIIAPHTWSLAVEEHFYILLPIILGVFRSGHVLFLSLFLCLVGCPLSRWIDNPGLPTAATHHNLDSLAFGALLSYLYHFRPTDFERISRWPKVLLAGGAILVVLGLFPGKNWWPAAAIDPVLLYLGYGMILVALVAPPINKRESNRFFRSLPARFLIFVGIYSFSIYLWHIDVAYRLVDLMSRAGMLAEVSPSLRWMTFTAVYVLAAIGFGVLFGRCIELPVLEQASDRLFPRHNPSNQRRSSLTGAEHVSNEVST